MSFDALIAKVRQAEDALEASERRTTTQWRQVATTWRSAWTPGRIVIAGLASGFLAGHGNVISKIGGGNALQLFTALSGLIVGGGAQAAANEAEDLLREQAEAAPAASPAAAPVAERRASSGSDYESLQRYERMRRAGLV